MLASANDVPPMPFFWAPVLVLLFVLGLSVAMFVTLVRRWTTNRSWVEIVDWARNRRGFKASNRETSAPPPLDEVARAEMRAAASVSDGRTTLLRLEAAAPANTRAPADRPAVARWHVLVRATEAAWKPTGLRPAHAETSLLDLFSLSSFPLMGETQRFVVYGSDSAAARRLSKSTARALLPPDIGLLLHGNHLILDFSARPFDAIEFDRMIAVAEQVLVHLPNPE